MGYFSDALSAYYKRVGKQILFSNGSSLSETALEMWKRSGYRGVDASVLSRVLNGKRLFTYKQLAVFCDVLNLAPQEKSKLFTALFKEYFHTDDIEPSDLEYEKFTGICKMIIAQVSSLFYLGDSENVIKYHNAMEQLYMMAADSPISPEKKCEIAHAYGYSLLLASRSIAGLRKPKEVEKKLTTAVGMLESLSLQYDLPELNIYAQFLQADLSYMRGANTKDQDYYFAKAISQAKHVYTHLSDSHEEKLAALRLVVTSAFYIHDEHILRYAEQELLRLLSLSISINPTNATHLSQTITRGKVMYADSDPFSVETKVHDRFGDIQLENYFELSEITTRIETLQMLRFTSPKIIRPLIYKGLELTAHGSFPRHHTFLENQLSMYY